MDLTPFDGKDVLGTKVEVKKAGDGLSKGMAVDPRELHHGEKGVLIMEYEVDKIRFDQIEGTECLDRVHVLNAATTVLADADTIAHVRGLLDEQADRILRAKEKGQRRLSDASDDAAVEYAALLKAHGDGDHAGDPVPGCPTCDEELAAAADEAETPLAAKRRTRRGK